MESKHLSELQKLLDLLIGLKLQYVRKIGGSRNFGFGKLKKRVNRKGEVCEVAQYALHTSCPWRIEGPSGIVTGSNDVWYSVEGEFHEPDELSNDETRQDVQLKKLLSSSETGVIQSVDLSAWGDLRLTFSQNFHLVLFNDGSQTDDGEAWVFFPPDETESFFISIPQDLLAS